MDLARSLRCAVALFDRPGADLLRSRGQEADEPEQTVACAHELVKAGFRNAHLLKKRDLLLLRQLRDLLLELGADGDRLCAFVCSFGIQRFHIVVRRFAHLVLRDVRHIDHGL